MPTKVYLMRHGEVANGGEKRYNGHIDIDITERGLRQMHALAERLSGRPIAAVYSSDLVRSRKGAEIISNRLGISFTPLRGLRERSVGLWEGLTAEEIRERFTLEYEAWRGDLLNYRPPGGECLLDVKNRILPIYKDIVFSHSDKEIAFLLHGGVNRIIIADALGLDLRHLFRIDQSFGALNIIEYFDDGMPVVRLLNG